MATSAARGDDRVGERVSGIIPQLGDRDPDTRKKAFDSIEALGFDARPAMVAALRSPDPQIVQQARAMLLRLPWTGPRDPAQARNTMKNYGQMSPLERLSIARSSLTLPDDLDVKLRVINEDPSEYVRWGLSSVMRSEILRGRYENVKRLRAVDLTSADAPLLVLVAGATVTFDRKNALELFARAVQIESENPTIDRTGMYEAYTTLADDAAMRGDLAASLKLRIELVRRVNVTLAGTYRQPMYELSRFIAERGPFPDLPADIQRLADDPAAEARYIAGRKLERSGDAAGARAAYDAALAASTGDLDRRMDVGLYLLSIGWVDLAEREFRAIVSEPPGGNADSPRWYYETNAYQKLSSIAADRHDEVAAAEALEAAAAKLTGLSNNSQQLRAFKVEAAWRRLKIARATNDVAGIESGLKWLLPEGEADETARFARIDSAGNAATDIVLDLVPYLRSIGRGGDAEKLFLHFYNRAQSDLKNDPEDPVKINEVAWLCGRSGERVAEAVPLARQAVQICPDHGGFLDTLAEAEFRSGNIDEAIRLETRAAELRPVDAFIKEQLKRFQDAKARP